MLFTAQSATLCCYPLLDYTHLLLTAGYRIMVGLKSLINRIIIAEKIPHLIDAMQVNQVERRTKCNLACFGRKNFLLSYSAKTWHTRQG